MCRNWTGSKEKKKNEAAITYNHAVISDNIRAIYYTLFLTTSIDKRLIV